MSNVQATKCLDVTFILMHV